MTFADLLAEYEGPDQIGEQIWALLVEVTGNVCRRYPPTVYADDSVWTPDAVHDLAQSVALAERVKWMLPVGPVGFRC